MQETRLIGELRVDSTIVQSDGFEWNEAKALENYAKHGVTFEQAKEVFRDPFAIEREDDRQDYGEQRFIAIGMVEDRLLFVALCTRRRNHPNHLSQRSGSP